MRGYPAGLSRPRPTTTTTTNTTTTNTTTLNDSISFNLIYSIHFVIFFYDKNIDKLNFCFLYKTYVIDKKYYFQSMQRNISLHVYVNNTICLIIQYGFAIWLITFKNFKIQYIKVI